MKDLERIIHEEFMQRSNDEYTSSVSNYLSFMENKFRATLSEEQQNMLDFIFELQVQSQTEEEQMLIKHVFNLLKTL